MRTLGIKSMQLVSEVRYKAGKQYEARLESLGLIHPETSPLEYLNEHLVAGDFLGKEIPSINIRFVFSQEIRGGIGKGKRWSQNTVLLIIIVRSHHLFRLEGCPRLAAL